MLTYFAVLLLVSATIAVLCIFAVRKNTPSLHFSHHNGCEPFYVSAAEMASHLDEFGRNYGKTELHLVKTG